MTEIEEKQLFEISPIISKLIEKSEGGKHNQIKHLFESNHFTTSAVDIALRTYLRKNTMKSTINEETLSLYLNHKEFKINYRNPEENLSSIIMIIGELGDLVALSLVLKNFGAEIQFSQTDANSDNLLKYLITSNSQEISMIDFINCLFEYQETLRTNLEFIDNRNKDGRTPLSIALLYGYADLSQLFISLGSDIKHIVSISGDSMLHCAVLGKNQKCVQLLVKELNWVNYRNNSNLSAYEIAREMNLAQIISILNENKPSEMENKVITNPLVHFINGNYEMALKAIGFSHNNIKSTDLNNKSLADYWNYLLINYSILKKEYIPKDSPSSTKKDIIEITFKQYFTVDNCSVSSSSTSLFSLYNKALYHFFKFNYEEAVENITKIIDRQNKFSSSENNEEGTSLELTEKSIRIHSLFFLLSLFLKLKNTQQANHIIALISKQLDEEAETFKHNSDEQIVKYFKNHDILHIKKENDDLYSLLGLFKAEKLIIENKLEEVKICFNEFKKLVNKLKVTDNTSLFLPLLNYYNSLKCIYEFKKHAVLSVYKKIIKLYDKTNNFNDNFQFNVFYLNTLGIINLKQKKYNLSEYFFLDALQVYTENKKKTVDLFFITDMEPKIKYNLGLCYFYQKRYLECYDVLSELLAETSDPSIISNPNLYFRLGLCLLETELKNISKTEKYNDLISKLIVIKENSNTNNNGSGSNSEEIFTNTNFDCKQKLLLNSTNLTDESYLLSNNKHLQESIICFRNALLYVNAVSGSNSTTIFSDCSIVFGSPSKIISEVATACYLNLIFLLIITDQITEALFTINNFTKSDYFNPEVHSVFVESYQIEVYVKMQMFPEALNMIQQALNLITITNNNENDSMWQHVYFHKNSQSITKTLHFKIQLYVNLLKINLVKKNYKEVEKILANLLIIFNVPTEQLTNSLAFSFINLDLPSFVLNLLIYYYMVKEKYSEVIKIIKRGRLSYNLFQDMQNKLG